MIEEVYMPKFGMTMTEGKIIKWLKKEGDYVEKGEPLVEIETEKIVNSLDSFASGVVEEILYPEGETLAITTVIAKINTDKTSCAASVSKEETQDFTAKTDKIILEKRPYLGLRKTIGDRMKESLANLPQGTMTTRADMTGVFDFKKSLGDKGHKVGVTDIMVKIVGLALEKNPILNAAIVENEIVLYKSVNLGVAMGTEEALFVPVIHNVQDKNLLQISSEVKELSQKLKENRLSPEDMTGGTFTFNNMGLLDVDIVTAIINPPEAAILTIGITRKEVVVEADNSTSIRPLTTLSLSANHAVMDGVPVISFLSDIKEIMKNPATYLDI